MTHAEAREQRAKEIAMAALRVVVDEKLAENSFELGNIFREELNIYKLRTMVVNAEVNGPQWAAKNDRRITK